VSERAGKFVRAPDVDDQETSILFTALGKRRCLNPGRRGGRIGETNGPEGSWS
jgi:hypothetical protein